MQLAEQISEVHQQSRGTYGTPRLHAELRDRGHKHSRKRIDRIRRKLGLSGRAKRRYRPQTTDSGHDEPIAPNRLAQLPKGSRRDQIWVSDLTYIPTEEGWLYLAVIMDLYSRRIIGWAFAHHLGTELVAAALAMALVHRRPPEGLIHHSDRGVQYASAAYRQVLKAHGVVASMSRKGCCYDNAAMEAFWQLTKQVTINREISPKSVSGKSGQAQTDRGVRRFARHRADVFDEVGRNAKYTHEGHRNLQAQPE